MTRMTKSVKRGLAHLAEFGRCWLEADDWLTVDNETDRDDIERALEFVEKGGLATGGLPEEKR